MPGIDTTPKPQNNSETASMGQQQSPWHSPVPYLFGGLAAMLGLIAFALLILACSYWKLSGYLENSDDNPNGGDTDLEAGDAKKTKPQVMEEKFLVIMAGDVKPTYLATLTSTGNSSTSSGTSRSSSFMETDKSCTCNDDDEEEEEAEKEEMRSQSTGSQDEPSPQRPC